MNLPNLIGSVKQIAWAEKIRNKLIQSMEERMQQANRYLERNPESNAAKNIMRYFEICKKFIESETSAKIYIEFVGSRADDMDYMAEYVLNEEGKIKIKYPIIQN